LSLAFPGQLAERRSVSADRFDGDRSEVCETERQRLHNQELLQQRILRAFPFRKQRQRLPGDVGLEMRALLMRLEGRLIAEQFVEQELLQHSEAYP